MEKLLHGQPCFTQEFLVGQEQVDGQRGINLNQYSIFRVPDKAFGQAILPSDVILDNNYSGKVYLQAIDKAGKVLPAKLSPTSVNMKVDVELPHKDVPIVGKITGKKDDSIASYNFKLSKDTATISGEQKFIDEISSITANINVANITKETTIKVPLSQDNVTISPNVIDVTVTPVKK